MYLQLIRNQPKDSAITARLVINGRWFCNTMERVGFQIPAICYPIRVTYSPKFKRLLPIVQNVPQRTGIRFHRGTKPTHSTGCILVLRDNNNNLNNLNQQISRSQQHNERSTEHKSLPLGCVVPQRNVVENNVVDVVDNKIPVGCRSAADVEMQLTQLLLQAQNAHEEIILEVTDFRPGTEYGYNTPCPSELQKP